MKHIYLLSFPAGAGGDFLCSQIAKDDNFYPLLSRMDPVINRCDLQNPFEKFGITIKIRNNTDAIDNNIFQNIDSTYAEKNLIVPIHHFENINDINLPRLKGIKLYSNNLIPLYYILLWVKRWSVSKPITLSSIKLEPLFKNILKENVKKGIELIKRGYYYEFELPAIRWRLSNGIDIVENYFDMYQRMSKEIPVSWSCYNIDNLFLNPTKNVNEFSKLFNMSNPINVIDIEIYYHNNIQLVEKIFNEPYNNFISGNWLLKLKNWVKIECPNSYVN